MMCIVQLQPQHATYSKVLVHDEIFLVCMCVQMLKQHVSQLAQHRTFRLLTPLMVFSGLQQGFMFSDYNQVVSL